MTHITVPAVIAVGALIVTLVLAAIACSVDDRFRPWVRSWWPEREEPIYSRYRVEAQLVFNDYRYAERRRVTQVTELDALSMEHAAQRVLAELSTRRLRPGRKQIISVTKIAP